MCLFLKATPLPEQALLKLLDQSLKREAYVRSGKFRLVLRESEQSLYVFVVNPDLYAAQEDVVVLAGRHPGAVDLGCESAFPVPATVADVTQFRLRLQPGEGTVIRVTR